MRGAKGRALPEPQTSPAPLGQPLDQPLDRPKKGTKTKLFGVVLLIVGVLDCMLSWRGGLVVNEFYLGLLATGAALYAVGTIRGAGTSAGNS